MPGADADGLTAHAPEAAPVGTAPARARFDLAAVYTLVFAGAGWLLGLLRLYDNSFLWHLKTGEYILDHGVPHSDPYSFSAPGVKWIAQSWLAELVYGVLHRTVGDFSIRLLGAVLTASVLAITYRVAYRNSRDAQRAAGLTVLVLLCLYFSWSNRPLLFGFFFFAGLVYLVEVPGSWVARHAVWVLPPLLWLWANTHGSFILGYAYLGLHLLGTWWDGTPPWKDRSRSLLIGAGVALPLIALNPYGLDLLLFPFDLVGGRGEILSRVVEWRSPDFRSTIGIAFAVTVITLIVIAARGPHRLRRRDLVVVLPFIGLGLWAQRNVPIAAIVIVAVAARAVRRDEEKVRDLKLLPIFGAVMVAFVLALTAVSAGQKNFVFTAYPVSTLTWADQHGILTPNTRLLTDDAWAGYVIYRYWPQQKVFADDRFDMYPVPLMKDFLSFADGGTGWQKKLDAWGIDVVIWPKDSALSALLAESPAWRQVHRDGKAVVYVRKGSAQDAKLSS